MPRFVRAPLPTPLRVPHVAVVVPCHNYGHFLTDCVESIKNQPGVTTQVHIIDDASTDDSISVAERLAERFADVRVTRHETNRGHIGTYNEGLAQVDSDYVVLLSADDMLASGALRRATAVMERFPRVGLVYGHPQTFESTPNHADAQARNYSVWKGRNWITAQFRRGQSIIYSPEAVVRTSVHHAAGYYRPELPHSGDLELWLRIAEMADVARVNGTDQAYRRIHQASMMHTSYSSPVLDLSERLRAFESFLAGTGLDPARVSLLRRRAAIRHGQDAIGWATHVQRQGSATSGDIAEALAFAQKVYPGYRSLPVWQVFAAEQSTGLARQAAGAYGRIYRSMDEKIRWHRWHRYGF